MVFIEEKYRYLDNLKENTSLAPIVDFVFFDKVSDTDEIDLNNPHEVVNALMASIKTGDSQKFTYCYGAYSKKVPDERSPWINNNYLLFFFLIASMKFNSSLDWLRAAIAKRKKGLNNEEDFISDFFYNIANGNLQLKGQFAPYNVCTKALLRDVIINDEINGSLDEILTYTKCPFFKSEFLNLLYLKSFDVCIKAKDPTNAENEVRYKAFETIFLKRIDLLCNLTVYLLFLVIIFFAYRLLMQTDEQKRNVIVTLLGLGGITALEFFKLRTAVKYFLTKLLKAFFGHTKVKNFEA